MAFLLTHLKGMIIHLCIQFQSFFTTSGYTREDIGTRIKKYVALYIRSIRYDSFELGAIDVACPRGYAKMLLNALCHIQPRDGAAPAASCQR